MTDASIAKYFRLRIQAREDAIMGDLLSSTTGTIAASPEPLTAEKIERMALDLRAKLGPSPLFLSSKLFPRERAITVEGPSDKFTCAHPSLWRRFQQEMRPDAASSPFGNPLLPMFGIRVEEIDIEDDMTEERAKYLREIWGRLIDAFKVALTPLPEWLRNAPKFSQHG